jgi:hypothetical protein
MTIKRTSRDSERMKRLVTALHGGTTPPARTVRRSVAALRRQLDEQARTRVAIRADTERRRLKMQAPLIDLMRRDKRVADGLRDMRQLARRQRQRRVLRTPRLLQMPPRIGAAGGSILSVTFPPFPFVHAMGGGDSDFSAAADGGINFFIRGNGHGSWAWAGVGLAYRPLFQRTFVRIAPFASYSYVWNAFGYIFSAHSEGHIGIHVHRYNLNWQDPDPNNPDMQTYRADLWDYTAGEDRVNQEGDGNYSSWSQATPEIPLDGNSNYLLWVVCEGYCDDSGIRPFGYSIANGYLTVRTGWIVLQQSDISF